MSHGFQRQLSQNFILLEPLTYKQPFNILYGLNRQRELSHDENE
jgi:hypothetical protein